MATDVNSAAKFTQLPLLPLKDIVVFPHMIVPVFISEDLCINAVEEGLAKDKKIFLSAFQIAGQKGEGLESSLNPPFDVYDIGTVCTIMRTRKLPDGRMKVLIQGVQKSKVIRLVSNDLCPVVEVEAIKDVTLINSTSEVEAMIRSVRESLEKVVSLGKVLSPDILMILEDVKDPGRLADLVAANMGLKVEDAQRILSTTDATRRLAQVLNVLNREVEVYQMQVKIQSQAKEEIGKVQREHYLREQIRVLRNELGEVDGKDELELLWKKIDEVKLTDEAREELSRQLKRLERMHQETSEAALTRTHIEAVLSLPWGVETKDHLELKRVNEVLDEDHYGLDQIKERIIEYLAVKKLNPNAKSPILCFVGPPGVGKTSLGKSIARSMGREFNRISLGGVRDEADIRGHRKTYVGAFPGRVIQAIRKAGAMNPVIMLDEIDKLGNDHRGDPSSALLEVLDPSQNHTFVDHYVGVPFDLSRVLFIANANTLDSIPAPLRDRLEIIEVSGYTHDEKMAIANQFLIPRQIEDTGLGKWDVTFEKKSVQTIIEGYTRESGLRNLEKQIASVCRKLARKLAEDEEKGEKIEAIKVTSTMIHKLLGVSKYDGGFYHSEPSIGVSLGMAYTQYGGEVLAIETNMIIGQGAKLVLTGQLGEVMKESAQAALSYIRSHSEALGVSQDVLNKNELHVHVPAGAIPKDGPSAGITMATSLLSALLGRAPKAKTCMTGEITLHGKVLPIGGLKEKVLAAQREGMEHLIIPEKNRATYMALPTSVKKRLTVSFVKDFSEVFEAMFAETALKNSELKSTKLETEKLAS
jgi:ATP-dependent Lon protease